MAAGYPGTLLEKKLGFEPGKKSLLVNPPGDYQDFFMKNIAHFYAKKNEVPDIIHVFAADLKSFADSRKKIIPYTRMYPSISICLPWYKKQQNSQRI